MKQEQGEKMFSIITYDLLEANYKDIEVSFDYHCLYILENGKEAYIGETSDPVRRTGEHLVNFSGSKKKIKFARIHIITGLLAEETPAKHYENLLIKLMRVDKKFHVINTYDGECPHYYRKNEFELYFDELWFLLEEKGLVKTKEFELIINSNSYKYSPNTILTEEQHNALTSIIHTIDSGEMQPHKKGFKTRPIVINGDAGTGKTIVATSLFYYLRNNERYKGKSIALIYANTSMRYEIQKVFKNIDGLYKKDVISPIELTKRHYDIVICDETQCLRQLKRSLGGRYYPLFVKGNERLGFDKMHDELDWLLFNSTYQILFYDEKQRTSPCNISKEYFKERLYERKRGIRPIQLKEQMRIRAGREYVPYIYDILYQRKPQKKNFCHYEFKIFDSFPDMVSGLKEKNAEAGLSRFCTGYAWKWENDEMIPDISIDGVDIPWNSFVQGWISHPDTIREMGSIYTVHGLDLNYVGVVFGPDIYFDQNDNKIKVNKESFYDNKVKKEATDEELEEYILNTYAVFLTRGILGTYLYVCNENLREYLKKYIS